MGGRGPCADSLKGTLGRKPRCPRCCRHTYLRPHIYSPRSIGLEICVQRLMCTELAEGEHFYMGKCKFVFSPYKVGRFLAPDSPPQGTWSFSRVGGPSTGEPPRPSRPLPSGPQPPRCAVRARGGPLLLLGSDIEGSRGRRETLPGVASGGQCGCIYICYIHTYTCVCACA